MSDKEKELDHIRLKYKNTITRTINRIFPETENIENMGNLFGPYSYLSITWRIEHYLDDKTLTKLNTTNYESINPNEYERVYKLFISNLHNDLLMGKKGYAIFKEKEPNTVTFYELSNVSAGLQEWINFSSRRRQSHQIRI